MSARLISIFHARLKAGKLDSVGRIIEITRTARERVACYQAVASYHLARGRNDKCLQVASNAVAETARIGALRADDDVAAMLAPVERAARYTMIAELQIRAGGMDAAVKSIKLAQSSSRKDAKKHSPMLGGKGIFEAMGGSTALVALLIKAGKIDEATKMVTGKDGTIDPRALTLLALAHGASGKGKSLEELMAGKRGPEIEYNVYLHAAMGAAKKPKTKSGGK